jgi:flagellar motor switch protein FliN/FliY
LASDFSNIVKNEIVNTLENLLSATVTVSSVEKVTDEIVSGQCLKVESKFESADISSDWNFAIPTKSAAKFEYLMLGGVTDLKDAIDDEIADAVKEIISTISGSITTSINAQGFEDINGVKFSLGESSVIECGDISPLPNIFKFDLSLNDEPLILYISFDDVSIAHLSEINGEPAEAETSTESQIKEEPAQVQNSSLLSAILSEDSVDNLRLLMDIKLRLSVRLGTKICLLRDVISWDIGEIIELTQMTNEPLDILVNNVVIGQGEAIIVDGKFGVKIKHIGEPKLN